MKKLKKDKVLFPEAKERHKEMMNNLTTGKALIISEAEKRHKKDVQRIETTLKTAPDKRKYLENRPFSELLRIFPAQSN